MQGTCFEQAIGILLAEKVGKIKKSVRGLSYSGLRDGVGFVSSLRVQWYLFCDNPLSNDGCTGCVMTEFD